MLNFFVFVICFAGILNVPVFAIDLQSEPLVLRHFEVDEKNFVIREYDRIDNEHTETIVAESGYLRLECHSDYPVQWTYKGNGVCTI